MGNLLATPDRVGNKAGEAIESPEELGLALEMLESASNWVRYHSGHPEWTAETAPEIAVTITIAAATRGYLNPAAYLEERADANFIKRKPGWSEEAKLDPGEIAVLKTFNMDANISGIQSLPVVTDGLHPLSSVGRRRPDIRIGWTEPFTLEGYQ